MSPILKIGAAILITGTCLLAGSFVSASTNSEVNWTPLPGMEDFMYNSIEPVIPLSASSAIIPLLENREHQVTQRNGPVTNASSVVSFVALNCTTKMVIIGSTMHFKIKNPSLDDVAIITKENIKPSEQFKISSSHPIVKHFCRILIPT